MTDTPRLASFRQLDEYLKKSGCPRDEQMIRNNIYIAPLEWFAVEPGFNLRELDDEHVEQFAQSYEQGLYVPPVVAELAIIDGNPRLMIREGHHRLEGAQLAVTRGAALPGLVVSEFKGNKADAVVLMMNSSQSLPLTPLQRSEGYKRLAGQQWKPSQIAKKVGRSVQHVEQLLMLANADEAIKELIRLNRITSTTVIDVLAAVRGTGTAPLPKIMQMIDRAQARGKQRATSADAKVTGAKFRPGSKVSRGVFDALASMEDAIAVQVGKGDVIEIPLNLPAAMAKELLKHIQKFNQSSAQME